ncbi:MAG: hypothetical protein KF733_01950 [Fimbriimonadaceae bacterium]|nr:MAG: hypothetical protein KF733_01950 [Fimbriimonadaceae bacterium]
MASVLFFFNNSIVGFLTNTSLAAATLFLAEIASRVVLKRCPPTPGFLLAFAFSSWCLVAAAVVLLVPTQIPNELRPLIPLALGITGLVPAVTAIAVQRLVGHFR